MNIETTVIITAVGNFCMYPRTGVLVAKPVAGWPAGWQRAANALGYATEDGGIVVGDCEGYDAPRHNNQVDGCNSDVAKVLDWLGRHPEAATISVRPNLRTKCAIADRMTRASACAHAAYSQYMRWKMKSGIDRRIHRGTYSCESIVAMDLSIAKGFRREAIVEAKKALQLRATM